MSGKVKTSCSTKASSTFNYLPLETLKLEHSIAASLKNLIVFIKDKNNDVKKEDKSCEEFNIQSPSSVVNIGIINRNWFIIQQLLYKNSQPLELQLMKNLQIVSHPNKCSIFGNKFNESITTAQWFQHFTSDIVLLILVTNVAIYLYDEKGETLMSFYDFQHLTRALIRSLCVYQNTLIAGNDDGEILRLDYAKSPIVFSDRRKILEHSLCDMHCSNHMLLAGDKKGTIVVYKLRQEVKKIAILQTEKNECVTGCRFWKHFIVATYGSGVIRMYDISKKQLKVKISSHSRWIVGMDLSSSQDLLLTFSEDDFIRIWQLNDAKDMHVIELKSTVKLANSMMVGGKFITQDGAAFAISNYGARDVYLYKQV